MATVNFLYNPDRKSKGQLVSEFVIRQRVLEAIMKDLESSSMLHPEQHYLLVGQRGTGKTTLLNRIRYAIDDSPTLQEWLVPILFSEEQYNIGELADLWQNVAQILEDYHGFAGICDEMEALDSGINYDERCYDVLEKYLIAKNKKLVLLIDNLGDLLRRLDIMQVRRLRMILQTRPFLRVIAGAPYYLESVLDYQHPLYEFFSVISLKGLDNVETRELLLKLGEVHGEKDKIERILKTNPGRVETLRILAGGIPRTVALMFNIFVEDEHENSVHDLEKMLDLVTPLYKHRMDDLPAQQQKIVDAVAKNWDPIGVKELRDKVRLEGKVISAQLRQLEKNQVIEKMPTKTKNHEYILRERFFNIWYLMRYGRKDDKQRVIWLVRFLESWCSQDEMRERVERFVMDVKGKKLNPDAMEFFGQVYASMGSLSAESKFLVMEALPQYERQIVLTDAEIALKVDGAYSKGEFEECIKWMVYSSTFHPRFFVLLLQIARVLDERKVLTLLQEFYERMVLQNVSLDSNWRRHKIFLLITWANFIIINQGSIKSGEFELGIRFGKEVFYLTALVVGRTTDNWGQYYKQCLEALFIKVIKQFTEVGILHPLIEIFETERNLQGQIVKLSELFNPIYLALISLDPERGEMNLSPEKAEAMRSVRDFLTAKD